MDKIEEKFKQAELTELKMETSKQALKARLLKAYSSRAKNTGFSWYIKAAAVAVACAFTYAAYTVIDNMDDGDRFNKNGGVWSTYSDAHQGGDSSVWPPEHATPGEGFIMSSPGYGGSGWAVKITGSTGYALGPDYNYLGVVVRFDKKSACPTCEGSDISAYKGISFRIKGDLKGGKLRFILPAESGKCDMERMTCVSRTEYADYEYEITDKVGREWQQVMISFRDDLKQPSWTPERNRVSMESVLKQVHLFKWQYKNGSGARMEIMLDDVALLE